MRDFTLIIGTLCHFRKAAIAVALGAALGVAVLLGALIVGDSMTGSLRQLVADRLGPITHILACPRYFSADLAGRWSTADRVVAGIELRGSCIREGGKGNRRASRVAVLGAALPGISVSPGKCLLNDALAETLGVAVGGEVQVRVAVTPAISAVNPLGSRQGESSLLRLVVQGITRQPGLARNYSPFAGQRLPRNCWVNPKELARAVGQSGQANRIYFCGWKGSTLDLGAALAAKFQLADYGLSFRLHGEQAVLESSQVFLSPPLVAAAQAAAWEEKITTNRVACFLANTITRLPADGRPAKAIPYTMVGGLERLAGEVVGEGEIVINAWAKQDLGARVGDRIRFDYYAAGPTRPQERDGGGPFTVKRILPLSGPGADPTLTPVFAGVTDATAIKDWSPPADLPIDLNRIGPRDEDYWDRFQAAPKAFVSLALARKLWGSPGGDITSIRIPSTGLAGFTRRLQEKIRPEMVGFALLPLREDHGRGAAGTTDFGVLFISFSFFLIFAAALLVGLLAKLDLETRAGQAGLLLVLGFTPKRVRKLFLTVGMVTVLLGALIGVPGGLAYAAAMIYGLNHWWQGAVGSAFLSLHVFPATLPLGFFCGLLLAALAIWRAVKVLSVNSPRSLLAGGQSALAVLRRNNNHRRLVGGLLLLGLGAGWIGLALAGIGGSRVGAFFGGGAAFFGAFLLSFSWLLGRAGQGKRAGTIASLLRLGIRNAGRHRSRSLITVGLVAAATFTLVIVAFMRKGTGVATGERESGAGGYSLIAENDLPLHYSPGTAAGRRALAMGSRSAPLWSGVELATLRVNPGEELSCLNLYRPGRPRILGVPPEMIARGGFRFTATIKDVAKPWTLLDQPLGPGKIAAFADAAAAQWTLHKGLGESLLIKDERGRDVELVLVGLLGESIFQGELLVGDGDFGRLFPAITGYNQLLISAPPDKTGPIKAALEEDLADFGMVVDSTAARLALFAGVAGTYMSTFQVLGALGLLLGIVGMGVVMLRGMAERRREFALLAALGFTHFRLVLLVFLENLFLLVGGLTGGALAAMVAAIPQLAARDSAADPVALALTMLALFTGGALILLITAHFFLAPNPARDLPGS